MRIGGATAIARTGSSLPLGKVDYESGDALRNMHFPTRSIVSLPWRMTSGGSGAISVAGNEGVIEYTRRQIPVLDRPKLEGMCCECCAVVKLETL